MRDATRNAGDDDEAPDDAGDGAGEASAGRMLLRGLRAGDEQALAAVFERYVPMLLVEARRRHVQPGLRQEVVEDAVAAAVLVLMRPEHATPRSLAGYLVTALRRRVLNLHRSARRDAARASQVDDIDQLLVASAAPAPDARLDAHDDDGTDGADGGAHDIEGDAMDGIMRALLAQLAEDDRQLLGWLGEHVPQREIAAWLGVTHDAVRSRAKRLRARLRESVRRQAAALPPAARALVEQRLAAMATQVPGARPSAARPAHGHARRRGARDASAPRREP